MAVRHGRVGWSQVRDRVIISRRSSSVGESTRLISAGSAVRIRPPALSDHMDLLSRVRQTIRRHDLARGGTRVLVALSGGSDSVALAHVLRSLHLAGDLRVVGLAHFNHQLRAAASDDERFCEGVAASVGWPLLADRDDVGARARRERRSIEGAARLARHEFLERARTHFEADVVARGHTRDDQAETFLLRLIRGAGSRGLAAMHPRRGAIIRPLLDCRRDDLRAYLDSQRIAYVADESNEDVSIPRNRVRAELLPLLERRFNPSIVDVLADEAEIAREEWRWLHDAAEQLGAGIRRRDGGLWRIDADALNAAPPALARMIVHAAMTAASRGRAVSFQHVAAALRLSRSGAGPFDAPGQRLERVGTSLVLRCRPEGAVGRYPAGAETDRVANFFRYPLSIPGSVALAEAGYLVSAETAPSIETARAVSSGGPAGAPDEMTTIVRMDRFHGPLAVRNRRPGDRFRPVGLVGRKKLQDYFVDKKVARAERDGVPLVVDGLDRIVWVAGYSIDADFRVTDPAQAVLILRVKVLGGSA
jgi:tRNA(Ile)-lysidine synthase